MIVKLKELTIKQINDELFIFIKMGYRPSCYVANRDVYETIDISYNLETISVINFIYDYENILRVTIPNCNVINNITEKTNSKVIEIIKDSLDLDNVKEWGKYTWN